MPATPTKPPRPASPLHAAAELARRGETEAALAAFAAFRAAKPKSWQGYAQAAALLRRKKRFAKAAALCREGIAACGKLPVLEMELARVAADGGAPERALAIWRRLGAAQPQHATILAEEIRCLILTGRGDEAEARVTAALALLPDNAAIRTRAAEVAAAREDWPAAVARWNAVLALNPNSKFAANARGRAAYMLRQAAGDDADDTAEAAHEIADIERVEDPEARALLMQFESLGQNCEFGLVQRRYGAEPISLLRWSNSNPDDLRRYFESGFRGLAEPENLSLVRTDWGEYMLHDGLFDQPFHTFQRVEVADPDAYVSKHGTRLRFLRDKLIADFAAAEKIFVYRARRRAPDDTVRDIVRLARTLGPVSLLWVELADATNPAGTVRDLGHGLLRGYLSLLNPVRPGVWQIPYAEWLTLCRAALASVGHLPSAAPLAP